MLSSVLWLSDWWRPFWLYSSGLSVSKINDIMFCREFCYPFAHARVDGLDFLRERLAMYRSFFVSFSACGLVKRTLHVLMIALDLGPK